MSKNLQIGSVELEKTEAQKKAEKSLGMKKDRKRYTPEQAKELLQQKADTLERTGKAQHVQGFKDVRIPRMNVALLGDCETFVKTYSKVMGLTQSEFVCFCLMKYRKEHLSELEEAKALIERMVH